MQTFIIITGFLALCSTSASFFFDNKKIILMIQVCTFIFLGIHQHLLGAYGGAWLMFIQIGGNIFFSYTRNIYLLHTGLTMLIIIYSTIYLKSLHIDSYALLPYTGTILGTLGAYLSNTTLVRLFFLISTIPFTYYMVVQGTIFGIIIQFVFTTSILINILRFDLVPFFKKISKKNT